MQINSPHCYPYISNQISWENLFEYQVISSLEATFFILLIYLFEEVMIVTRLKLDACHYWEIPVHVTGLPVIYPSMIGWMQLKDGAD